MIQYDPNRIKVPFGDTVADLHDEFARWGVSDAVIVPRREPSPRADQGVSVEWSRAGQPFHLTMEKHPAAYQNIRVIYFAVKALRENEMRGLTDIMRDAYLQLAAPAKERDPWEVLGVRPDAPREVVEAAYRAQAKRLHPDAGGSDADMKTLNAAWEAMKGGTR